MVIGLAAMIFHIKKDQEPDVISDAVRVPCVFEGSGFFSRLFYAISVTWLLLLNILQFCILFSLLSYPINIVIYCFMILPISAVTLICTRYEGGNKGKVWKVLDGVFSRRRSVFSGNL